MVKLSGSISRKVPIVGIEYSSQSYSAGLEVEVSDGESPEVIKERIRSLYALLSSAIDEQIGGAVSGVTPAGNNAASATPLVNRQHAPPPQTPQPANPGRASYSQNRGGGRTNGNGGNGRRTTATEAQCRAIYAICKSLNLDMNAVLADYSVASTADLTVKDASRLIDDLKSRQTNAPARG
ncbi:MAG: hypothetical protein NTW87_04340 [Planctomycetota bacterium]|nr:hypothetical protein [Planctomycetota bacterium]